MRPVAASKDGDVPALYCSRFQPMTLVALLMARGGTPLRALLPIAGQTLLEYQARQATAAGAAECAVVVDAVTPDLAAAVDRLQRDSIRVTLIRDLPSLGRLVSLDDRVLIMGEGHVLPTERLRELAALTPPIIMSLPATPETRDFERIDGDGMWAGAALSDGALLLSTIDMLGEWDLCLTILRRLVQEGAQRMICDVGAVMDGSVAIVRDAASASAAQAVLARRLGTDGDRQGLDDVLLGRAAGVLARAATRRGLAAEQLRAVALGCIAVGSLFMATWNIAAGAALALAGLLAAHVGVRVKRTLRLTDTRDLSQSWPVAMILIALFFVGWRVGGGSPLSLLGSAMVPALVALAPLASKSAGSRRPPFWMLIGPASATAALLLGALLAVPAAALALVGLTAFAGCAWSLRRSVE